MRAVNSHALALAGLFGSSALVWWFAGVQGPEVWGTLEGCMRRACVASLALASAGLLLVLLRLRDFPSAPRAARWFAALCFVTALWLPLVLCAQRGPEAHFAGWSAVVRLQLLIAAVLAVVWLLEVSALGDRQLLLGAFFVVGNSVWMDLLVWPCFMVHGKDS